MPSEQAKAVFDAYAASPSMAELSLERQREVMEELPQFGAPASVVEVTSTTLGGCPAELAHPASVRTAARMLYVHGGGFVAGSVASHRNLVGHLADAARMVVASVDYRRAPEHRFPAALDDVVAAFRDLRADGFEELVLAGDSAGAALALAAALRLAGGGVPVAAVVLLSPWLDLASDDRTPLDDPATDPVVDQPSLDQMAAAYLGGHDATDPAASPLRADLTVLPPTFVQVGEGELLADDARRLAAAASAAGAVVELSVWPGMFHVFQACAGQVPEADQAVAEIGSWLRGRLATGA